MMRAVDTAGLVKRLQEELLGRYFSNKSELRHMAEKVGFNFVPVEFLTMRDQEAVMTLRPVVAGEHRLEVLVRATRPVPWQPYLITDVGPEGA
jgi:hypothetical protein